MSNDGRAVALAFVARINAGDLEGLVALMAEDHRLEVFDTPAVVGREANRVAWRGYMGAFPEYVIHPRAVAERDGAVAILGHTTGSHLGLPDDVERERTLIWLAYVRGGVLERWRLIEDTPAHRQQHGLTR